MLRRPRRNRKSEAIRSAVRETHLAPANLVLPLFLLPGENKSEVMPSLPVASRMTLDFMIKEIEASLELGLDKFMIFPAVPDEHKDKMGTYSYAEENFYLRAAEALKREFPDATLISDVAMDPYSKDGHDGLVIDGEIVNDITLPILDKMAVAQAQAGFDIIGPSDMMDGRVESIRRAMDDAGYYNTSIMSYCAKYASGFYGPFRDALDSAPGFGDKKSYQMDPANKREALIEAELDTIEGADFLMVKPALNYLDVIHMLDEECDLPIAAYHVSGECAMLLAACDRGWLDYDIVMPETLLSIKRAGAQVIMTYLAKSYAEWYRE